MTPEEVIDDHQGFRPARPRRRRLPHGHEVAVCRAAPWPIRSMSAATPTKATPARSWTVPFWKATPMPLWRLWPSPATPSAPTRAMSMSARNTPLPSSVCRSPSNRHANTACWARTFLGTGFNFDLDIRLGAGAFVCGEETALMTSIEGKRGEPRPRPPFPAVKGLFDKPTILNNVETYANIAQIILNGRGMVCLHGHREVQGHQGLRARRKDQQHRSCRDSRWVPLCARSSMRSAAACPNGKKFKAAQTGGPSGGCIPASLLDTPIDYDNLHRHRLHDGLRRPDRHGRRQLHGRYRQVLPRLHRR